MTMKRLPVLVGVCVMSAAVSGAQPVSGPLRVCEDNPRYFADGEGKPVLLVGTHVWNSLQDMGLTDPPEAFDWEAYLDFLERYSHNFIRLWHWDLTIWDTASNREKEPRKLHCAPHPWPRTGPDEALDGKPRFDLEKWDETFFTRLRERCVSAGERGIYVSVMLFEGWGLQFVEDGWNGHPFHPGNNVNGVDGGGLAVHELGNDRVTALQEAYVRKVIDTVNDLDNVLYEISNENHPASAEWQYHMIDLIHEVEGTLPKAHPVGMTFQYKGGSNQTLFDSPAEWISPNPDGGYRDNPPAADGSKVIVTDTDHLWGIGGNQAWVWKSLCRGLNPIFMDPYDGVVLRAPFDPQYDPIRANIGHALRYSRRMDLRRCVPANGLASTGYCLSDGEREFLVYLPEGGAANVDLSKAEGELAVEWFDPTTGEATVGAPVAGGGKLDFTTPFEGDAVLFVRRRGG